MVDRRTACIRCAVGHSTLFSTIINTSFFQVFLGVIAGFCVARQENLNQPDAVDRPITGDRQRINNADPSLPVASAGPSQTVNAGTTLRFTGSVEGGTGPFSYFWSWGDGATTKGSSNPSHAYSKPGVYTAVFSAVDSLGHLSSSSATVIVNKARPKINAHGPYSGSAGSNIQFKGMSITQKETKATDSDYLWDFGDAINAGGLNP